MKSQVKTNKNSASHSNRTHCMLWGKDRGDVQWAKYTSPYSLLCKFITKTFDILAKVLEDECGTIAFLELSCCKKRQISNSKEPNY